MGRFIQADNVIPNPSNPLDFDRYAYVRNSPFRFNDPTGHVCSDPEDPTPTCEITGPGLSVLSKKGDSNYQSKEWIGPLRKGAVNEEGGHYEGCWTNKQGNFVCGHIGTDYLTLTGTNLYASGYGTVVVADMCDLESCVYEGDRFTPDVNQGYGNVIVIEYPYESLPAAVIENYKVKPGQSIYMVYAHLNDNLVEPGDRVNPGQLIGHTGDTGNSTGPHLHLEVRLYASGLQPGVMCGSSCYDTYFYTYQKVEKTI